MAKTAVYSYDDPGPRRRPRWRRRAWIAFGFLLVPLAADGTRLIVARWRAMYGTIEHVETPALDRLEGAVHALTDSFQVLSTRPFRDLPWRGETVLTVALAWALIGTLMMRSRWR